MSITQVREQSSLAFSAGFRWPDGFGRIPDEEWTRQPVDEFGLNYDSVGAHSWYKNLEPTVAQVLAALDPGRLLVDYSSGTGILTRRLLEKIPYPVGVVNVDASAKFLRVSLENFAADERVAFRLLRWLKDEKRLERLDEVMNPALFGPGADVITSTNAIHLYRDLDDTLASWARVLKPGGLASICSGNMYNPAAPAGNWIIDDTVAKVNEIAAGIVASHAAFGEYRATLGDSSLMARHHALRDKVFVPVRPLGEYVDAFERAGLRVLHVFDETIAANVDDWYQFLATYHDGVLSWVGGSPKVEGAAPSPAAVQDRLFLIRCSLDKLFPGQESFPCSWSYLTCRR